MSVQTQEPTWVAAHATARGSSHVSNGAPNQDAVGVTELPGAIALAVADGHGGARYVRSEIGSSAAVRAALEASRTWWQSLENAGSEDLGSLAVSQLLPDLLATWQTIVLSDHAARPFSEEEEQRGGGGLARDPLIAYGATLLLAVATSDRVLLCQLGDGDVTVVNRSGRVSQPVPGDDRLVGGATTSLCLPTALEDFRVSSFSAVDIDLLALSTDGYGNSFADHDWYQAVGTDVLKLIRSDDVGSIEDQLPAWVADSARVGGDDVTVALLWRSADGPTAPAPAPARPRQLEAERSSVPSGQRGLRWFVAGALAALTVGAAVTIGLWPQRDSSIKTVAVVPAPGSTRSAAVLHPAPSASRTPSTPPAQVPVSTSSLQAIVGQGGAIVVFSPVIGQARPVMLRVTSGQPAETTAVTGGNQWTISGGALSRRDGVGAAFPISLRASDGSNLTPEALLVAGEHLWVFCTQRQLVAVGTTTFSQVLGSLEPVSA